ncbi:MAG TPA: carboxypeptidase regulatory-like domain-containing protein [Longimicrobiaceae bacterium]|jgi:plastocyanin|nr:carboxypeptidase regulatory-like domain-containing protein [Longimicrobiaceae bacterium]
MNRPARIACLAASALAFAVLPACSGGGGGSGGGTTNPPTTGTISGSVTADGAGVNGATVAITGGASATTGNSGAYSFGNLAPGSYTLHLTRPAGFTLATGEDDTKPATVQAGATSSVTWSLHNTNASNDIHIGAQDFSPPDKTVSVGATVRWINDTPTAHTITNNVAGQAGAWASHDISGSGTTFTHTFTTAGVYDYHCTVHAGMTGRIAVQ